MGTKNSGLYSIDINGIKLYSTNPDELLMIARECELRGCSVTIRYPNGEIMYGGRWEDV